MLSSTENLQLQDAIFRQKLRNALGISSGESEIDPEIYKLIYKKRKISSILRQQMKEAGYEDLAKQTRLRRG